MKLSTEQEAPSGWRRIQVSRGCRGQFSLTGPLSPRGWGRFSSETLAPVRPGPPQLLAQGFTVTFQLFHFLKNGLLFLLA